MDLCKAKSEFQVWFGIIPDMNPDGSYKDHYVSSAFSAWCHQQRKIDAIKSLVLDLRDDFQHSKEVLERIEYIVD